MPHSFVAPQADPCVFFVTQAVPLQYEPAAQEASPLQVVGQLALDPLHTKVPQLGAPPVVTFLQVPFVVAPAATEQASQLPLHALSQQ